MKTNKIRLAYKLVRERPNKKWCSVVLGEDENKFHAVYKLGEKTFAPYLRTGLMCFRTFTQLKENYKGITADKNVLGILCAVGVSDYQPKSILDTPSSYKIESWINENSGFLTRPIMDGTIFCDWVLPIKVLFRVK